MAQRCSLQALLSETRTFGVARLSRLLHQLGTDLELALRTGVCTAPLSLGNVIIEDAGTPEERARLPLSPLQSGAPELEPALRELGGLIERLLAQLTLGVDEPHAPAPRAPTTRRADQPLLRAWHRTAAAIARRCTAGTYVNAAELVRNLERLSQVTQRIVARRRAPPTLHVSSPKPAHRLSPLPKVMLRVA